MRPAFGGARRLRLSFQEPPLNLDSLFLAGVQPGKPYRSPAGMRRLGMLLVVIGAALALAAGTLVLQLAPTLLNPGELIGGDRFTGSAALGRQLLALLVTVALLGAACAAMGLQQWRSGQPDRRWRLLAAAMVAAALLMAARAGTMLG